MEQIYKDLPVDICKIIGNYIMISKNDVYVNKAKVIYQIKTSMCCEFLECDCCVSMNALIFYKCNVKI